MSAGDCSMQYLPHTGTCGLGTWAVEPSPDDAIPLPVLQARNSRTGLSLLLAHVPVGGVVSCSPLFVAVVAVA